LDGDDVFVAVGEDDVDDMLRTNKTQFAGTIITVVRSDERPSSSHGQSGGVSASAQETKAKLQDILSKRFDPSLKLLKLDFLSTDEELVRLGMFETKDRAEKTFQVFMVILDDLFKSATSKREGIESITVANNGIDHVKQIGALANTFPDIKNLELAGNALPSMAALEPWKGRFRELTMINVAGNPLANDPAHREHLMRWFPRLQLIDGVQVRTPEEAAAAANAGKPRPIPQFGLDFRDANGVGESFLLDFFVGYDTNRPALVAKYYDDATQFSLAVDTASVRDPNGPPIMPWGPYLKYSRNLQKVTHPSTRVQRLLKGATHILDLWKMLPSTSHPDIKLELSKYIVDCHIVPGLVDPSGGSEKGVDGMIITVHGEFDEQDQKANLVGKRSFSRTFILGPGLPGRNPIRVVNDMWTLRAAKALPVVVGGGGGGGGGDAQAAVPEQQQQPAVQPGQTAPAIPAAEHEQKQALIAELCRQTGMTAMYSEMCLGEVGWDLARGVAIFNEKRVSFGGVGRGGVCVEMLLLTFFFLLFAAPPPARRVHGAELNLPCVSGPRLE
jgi:nuclear RNA export factor